MTREGGVDGRRRAAAVGRRPGRDTVEARRLVGLAKELGLPRPSRPHGELTAEIILAANRESDTFPGLAEVEARDLASEETTLLPAGPNPFHRHPIAAAFAGTGINPTVFAAAETEALVLRRFHDVTVVRGGGFVSVLRGDRVDAASSGLVVRPKRLERMAHAVQTLPRAAVCDGPHKSSNPAHILGDRLPRGVLMERLAGVPGEVCAVGTDGSPFARAAAEAVLPGHIHLDAGRPYRFETLEMLTSSFRPAGHPLWYLDAETVDTVRSRLLGRTPRREGARMIYLARTDTSRRPLGNERELIAALAARGVVPLTMSELVPEEQWAAVHAAETVIAPHGGALMNVLLARPGTRVVELFNPSAGTAGFAAVSLAVGAHYTPLFGTPTGEGDGWTIAVDTVLDAAFPGTP